MGGEAQVATGKLPSEGVAGNSMASGFHCVAFAVIQREHEAAVFFVKCFLRRLAAAM